MARPGGAFRIPGPTGPRPIGPGAGDAVHRSDFWHSLRRLLARLRAERVRLAGALLLGAGSVAFTVSGPKILGAATNVLFDGVIGKLLPAGLSKAQAVAALRARGQGQVASMIASIDVTPGKGVDLARLGAELALAASVYLLGAALSYAQGYLLAGIVQRTMLGLRGEVENKLGRLPLRYFDSHPHGDVLSRVTNDIDNLGTTLQQGFSQLVTSVLTIVGVLAMMISISPLLAAISLVTIPLALVVTLVVARRSQVQFGAQWEKTGTLNGLVEETHTGHVLVQLFGRRQSAVEEFDRQNGQLYEASFRAQFLSGVIQPSMQFIANLNYVAIAVLGGYRVASGLLSLGDVQAFIQYSRQFTMPITQIASQMNLLQSGMASAERVFEFLDAEEEPPDPLQARALPRPLRGHLLFDHVSFRYQPDEPLIEDFDLEVEPGETVALVGPTGAGKTTMVNLLVRFYEASSGRICLDGCDYRELSKDEVRSAFGMVLQDTWLFSGSVADNIGYGRLGASREDVVAAAEAADLDHFVRTLPDGYDTVLDAEAPTLSSGQKQLLTIARAFLADPPVLILDEATSNVDTRTELLVQAAMSRLRSGRTSFVIAHRLSTIRGADTIVVMDHGHIVEMGGHQELLARGGFYASLYASQFGTALAPG